MFWWIVLGVFVLFVISGVLNYFFPEPPPPTQPPLDEPEPPALHYDPYEDEENQEGGSRSFRS